MDIKIGGDVIPFELETDPNALVVGKMRTGDGRVWDVLADKSSAMYFGFFAIGAKAPPVALGGCLITKVCPPETTKWNVYGVYPYDPEDTGLLQMSLAKELRYVELVMREVSD